VGALRLHERSIGFDGDEHSMLSTFSYEVVQMWVEHGLTTCEGQKGTSGFTNLFDCAENLCWGEFFVFDFFGVGFGAIKVVTVDTAQVAGQCELYRRVQRHTIVKSVLVHQVADHAWWFLVGQSAFSHRVNPLCTESWERHCILCTIVITNEMSKLYTSTSQNLEVFRVGCVGHKRVDVATLTTALRSLVKVQEGGYFGFVAGQAGFFHVACALCVWTFWTYLCELLLPPATPLKGASCFNEETCPPIPKTGK